MNRPTPQEARRRRALVEARLRNATPIWRSEWRSLFQSNDGYYVIDDRSPGSETRFIGITPDGEVVDLSGYPVDGGDVNVALYVLKSADLAQLAKLVIDWPLRRGR